MTFHRAGQTVVVNEMPADVCEKTAQQYESGDSNRLPGAPDPYAREWRAMLQRIEPTPPVPPLTKTVSPGCSPPR